MSTKQKEIIERMRANMWLLDTPEFAEALPENVTCMVDGIIETSFKLQVHGVDVLELTTFNDIEPPRVVFGEHFEDRKDRILRIVEMSMDRALELQEAARVRKEREMLAPVFETIDAAAAEMAF